MSNILFELRNLTRNSLLEKCGQSIAFAGSLDALLEDVEPETAARAFALALQNQVESNAMILMALHIILDILDPNEEIADDS